MDGITSPAAGQPGTLAAQLAAAETYLRLPATYRRRWPRAAWRAAREAVLPHARRPVAADLDQLAAIASHTEAR